MGLQKKTIYNWGFYLAMVAILSGACWYAAIKDEYERRPMREPALEVSESQVVAERRTMVTHVVEAGETLSSIAEVYGIDTDTLYGANEDLSEYIIPGQKLLILPQKGVLYKVQPNDSLWLIARMFQVEVNDIINANERRDDFVLQGEQLFIPHVKPLNKSFSHVTVSRMADSKFILPSTGIVSSPFGQRWGRMHEGVDIADEAGTPIVAAFSGKVSYAGWISGYGYSVILDHQHGYTTLYGHMENILVGQEQSVRQGQVIGRMGSTGNSTGPHVHFEVRKNGEVVDPVSILR